MTIFIGPEILLLVLLGKTIFFQNKFKKVNYQNKVKPVIVAKVYSTKFSRSLVLLKILENLTSIEKMYRNESRKSLSLQLLFKVSLFRFHFVSQLQYLDYYCNKCPMKTAAFLYLKLPLKPAFFQCLFIIFERENIIF